MSIDWNFPGNNFGTLSGIGEAGIETFKGSPPAVPSQGRYARIPSTQDWIPASRSGSNFLCHTFRPAI